jgi:hypothetical protein
MRNKLLEVYENHFASTLAPDTTFAIKNMNQVWRYLATEMAKNYSNNIVQNFVRIVYRFVFLLLRKNATCAAINDDPDNEEIYKDPKPTGARSQRAARKKQHLIGLEQSPF